MSVGRSKKFNISIQEHMAIDVCPGPIRAIRQISTYFPRLSPTSLVSPTSPVSPTSLVSPTFPVSPTSLVSPTFPVSPTSLVSPTFPVPTTVMSSMDAISSDSDDCTSLGMLEFELRYEQTSSQLHCTVLRAKGLKPMDFNGLADPYVKVHLLPGACKANKLKTKTVRNCLNPVWEETLTYVGITQEDIVRKTLRLTVCDQDKLTQNQIIGQSRVALRRLHAQHATRFHTCLEHPPPLPSPSATGEAVRGISCYLREWEEQQLHSLEERGRLLLSLQFLPLPTGGNDQTDRRLAGGLCVGVKRCAHLAAMDVNGFSDPYVKIYLKPDMEKKSKHKTAVVKKTLNPEFNQEFFYEISRSELVTKTLEVTVWDYDLGRSNDFIGGVCLGAQSLGHALRHWTDCLKNQGQQVERWHILTNQLPRSVSHN
ncbi:double C2-like domain-containing protein alpha [Nerophis lumbriciformis]|uniref:double C2-like domain-containing protein alpha n=1 Tax=Nerophis lumbriciformis TaxID=546530 RepID=UPI003BA9F028